MNLQLCWETLLPMREEEDPFRKAQAWIFMASASIFTHNITRAKHYLTRVVEIVKRNGIRFVSGLNEGDDGMVGYTEDMHERAAFMAQLLYWLTYLYLLDGHSEGYRDELERQFRDELPVCLFF
jgi:hypothetical protein